MAVSKIVLLILSCVTTILNIGFSQDWRGDLDKVFSSSEEDVDVLVKFKSSSIEEVKGSKAEKGMAVYQALRDQARTSQKEVRKYFDLLGLEYESYWIANTLRVSANRQILAEMPDEGIEYVRVNKLFRVPEVKSSTTGRNLEDIISWGLPIINADLVWELGITGKGVLVGGHDTGVQWDHPALKTKYNGWLNGAVDHNYNWHDAIHEISLLHRDSVISESNNPCGLDVLEPCDDVGSSHGTHTIGTMVGSDSSSGTYIGVAPGARWIAVRNMERGYGSIATYLEGFQWFLAPTDLMGKNPDPSRAPHVINNSWACIEAEGCNPGNFDILEEAVNNLADAGIVVVVSAGNSGRAGCSTITNPAAIYKSAFTIGATTPDDTLAAFSSKGPVMDGEDVLRKPDVVAPGTGIMSAVKGGGYGNLSGTSMSAPHVTGLVALIIEANPDLAGRVEDIHDIIRRTAIPIEPDNLCGLDQSVPNAYYGYGRIDAWQAVQEAFLWTSSQGIVADRGVNIFPNPARDYIIVDLGDEKPTKVSINNLMGQTLISRTITQTSSVSFALKPGTYFVSVHKTGQHPVIQKIQIVP